MGWMASILAAVIVFPLACATPEPPHAWERSERELVLEPQGQIDNDAFDRSVTIIEIRLRLGGFVDATVAADGSQIRVLIPKITEQRFEYLKRSIGQPGAIEMSIADDDTAYMQSLAQYVRADLQAQQLGIVVEDDFGITDDGPQRGGPMLIGPSEAVLREYVRSAANSDPRLVLPSDRRLAFSPYEAEPIGGWRMLVLDTETRMTLLPLREVSVDRESCSFELLNVGWLCEREIPDRVEIALHTRDVQRFSDLTHANAGNQLVVQVDNEVHTAARVLGRIDGGRVELPLSDGQTAQQLATIVGSGPLPIAFEVVSVAE